MSFGFTDVAPEYTGKTYLWTYLGEDIKVLVRRTHCISNGVVAVCKVLKKNFVMHVPRSPIRIETNEVVIPKSTTIDLTTRHFYAILVVKAEGKYPRCLLKSWPLFRWAPGPAHA